MTGRVSDPLNAPGVSTFAVKPESDLSPGGDGEGERSFTVVATGDPVPPRLSVDWTEGNAMALAAQLAASDWVRLTGDGVTEEVQIAAGWGGASPLTFATALANSYREGALTSLSRVAARVGTNTVRVVQGRVFYVGALVELDNNARKEYFWVDAIAGNVLTLSGNTTQVFNVGNRVRLAELKLSVRYLNETFRWRHPRYRRGSPRAPRAWMRLLVC